MSAYPPALQAVLLIILLAAASVWIGGWVSLILISRTTTATLKPADRVAFFRRFGRVYGITTTIALVIGLVTGLILLLGMPWNGLSTWLVVLSVILLVVLAAGIVQARRQTEQRRTLARNPGDGALAARVRRTGVSAKVLRAGLGVISLVILVLGVWRGFS